MKKLALRYLKWGVILICFDINIGRVSILPAFAGWLFFLAALREEEQTETEKRLIPFLYILTADSFLHWLNDLTNIFNRLFDLAGSLELLVITVINVYTVYVLIGELKNRIRETQPETDRLLEKCQLCYIVIQTAYHLVGVFESMVIPLVLLNCIWIGFMLKALSGIEPVPDQV